MGGLRAGSRHQQGAAYHSTVSPSGFRRHKAETRVLVPYDLRERAQRYFARYKAAYTERDYLRRPVEELFPASFPVVARRSS